MALTLRDEVWKIFALAGNEVENPILSCNEGDPSRTDDDTCRIDQIDWTKYMSSDPEVEKASHHPTDVRVDDVFTFLNAQNAARKTPAELDTHNYFFRLDSNAVFFRRESYKRENLGEGGMLFRAPGSIQWQRVDSAADVAKSPALKAAVVPILLRMVGGRADYDRLNGKPHHGDDYGYAQAKAIRWLNDLIPAGDSAYREALVRAFPAMNVDGMWAAWFRLQSEGREGELQHALAGLLKDPARGETARAILRHAAPSVSPQDWSLETAVVWRPAWDMSGGVYLPAPLRRAPDNVSWRGDNEPVGSYVSAGLGVRACIGPRIDCSQDRGFRVGLLGQTTRVLNGFGFYSFDGRLYAGNENVVGYVEAGVNLYPTGGHMGEGNYGDLIFHPNLGAGLRGVFHSLIPIALSGGLRMNPTDPKDLGFLVGLGGGQ